MTDRRAFIGGSDIASILNIQPKGWRTSYQTWTRKAADLAHEASDEPPPAQNEREMARGKIVEPLVASLLEYRYGWRIPVRNERFVDPDVPYFASEIDGIVDPQTIVFARTPAAAAVSALFNAGLKAGDIVNLEIKTVSPWRLDEWGGEDGDEIPLHYQAQVMWGLGVTRRRFALCAALFGADELRLYPVVADDETIAGMRQRARDWWLNYVVPRVPPPPATIGDTRALWPTDNGLAKDANADIVGACRALRALRDKSSTYEKGIEGTELLIREYMTDASELVDPQTGATLATLKAQSTSSIDAAKLKAEFPEVYKAVARKGTTRVLRLKD